MNQLARLAQRATQMWQERSIFLKAASFAMIGVVNTIVDATVFFTGYAILTSWPAAGRLLGGLGEACACASTSTAILITANLISWSIALSGSYVMNSHITFAMESGRQLRWRAYGKFFASGIAGVTVNTTVLVLAAKVMPVWGAKGLAILASFVVNFSLSNFVVFRQRHPGRLRR